MTTTPKTALTSHAGFKKSDGRLVVIGETDDGRLVLVVQRRPHLDPLEAEWVTACGPYSVAEIQAHAEAVAVGDKRAMTEPSGHRALAMLAIALLSGVKPDPKGEPTSEASP